MKITAIAFALSLTAMTGASSSTASASPDPSNATESSTQQHSATANQPATPFLAPGVTLRELLRLYNGKQERHATLTYFPNDWYTHGWRHEGTYGFISSTPFENSRPIYLCAVTDVLHSFFTSTDVGCEGQFLTSFGLIGYISTVPLPDTAPLYRCQYVFKRKTRHFDTRDIHCEQAPKSSNDGLIGYVFL